MRDVPYGFCHCGCGEKTSIADRTRLDLSMVKGEPMRYRRFHHWRRTEALYRVDPESGCWLWQSHINERGYAKVALETPTGWRSVYAHRWMYQQHHGLVPDGHELHHVCETKHCVNPDHVRPVTRFEHSRVNPANKLDQRKADAIRASSKTAKELAEQYGVTRTAIYHVRQGKTWRTSK